MRVEFKLKCFGKISNFQPPKFKFAYTRSDDLTYIWWVQVAIYIQTGALAHNLIGNFELCSCTVSKIAPTRIFCGKKDLS